MNEKELKEYEEKVKKYKNALNYVYTDGTVSGAERTSLENLKNELGLTADECRNFEQPYVLAKKAEEEGKQLHFEDICDCHHMYLCHNDDSLRWESIDGSGVENIEIGDTYIEKYSAGGFGTHDAFITIGESVEDLLSKYGENNFPEQAVIDGKVILFDRSEFGTERNIDNYLMARFNILTPLEIEEQYAEGLGEHGEVLQDYIRQTNKKEFYDVFLNTNDLRKTGTFLSAMITVKDDIDLYAFKPPFKMKNQDIQLVEWDEKDIPVIAELDTENGFRNLLRELYEYYKDNKEWETEVECLSVLLDAYERGINEDRFLEAKWDELEDVPFITDENGNEILDAEEGWRHFNKGTSKEEILKYFDFNHSKGVAYLVNDYPADKAIKEYIEKNFSEDAAHYIQSHVVSKLLDEGREITEMSLKEIAEKAINELDEDFNALDDAESIKDAQLQYEDIYREFADTTSDGVNKLKEWEETMKNKTEKELSDEIYEWLVDTHYKTDNYDFDMVTIKNDVTNLTAISLIKDLAKEDLTQYDDATSLSKFIDKKMKEHQMLIMPEDNYNYTEDIEPMSSFANELWNNNALQKEVVEYAASISDLEVNKNVGLLNEAKQLIENFTFDTSMSTPTFEDLKNVGIFAGKWEDPYTHQKLDVNVTANLIYPSITTTVNNTPIFSEEFENLQDMIALSLSSLQEEKFMNIHKDNPIIKDLREDFAYDIQKEAQKVLDESFGEDIEANISNSAIYIPSDYGFEKDKKLHILLEVNSDEREDELFNALAEKGFTLPDGTEVDFNPITPKEHGSIEEYLEHLQHLNENERWKKNNEQTVKTENKLSDEDVISSFKEKLKRDVKKYDLDTQVSCVLDSAKSVLKGFSNEAKKIIGKWLMDSGADSPIALQKKLENEVKPKKIEQKREITRHRDEPLHTR